MKLTSLSAKTNEEKNAIFGRCPPLSSLLLIFWYSFVQKEPEISGNILFIGLITYTNMVFARDSLKTQICILHFPPF